MNISLRSDKELEEDRLASITDIQDCKNALFHGVTKYSGGSVQDRIDGNNNIIKIITAEQSKRSIR